MRIGDLVACRGFSCSDINRAGYQIPDIELQPEKITILLISESAPARPDDHSHSAVDLFHYN